MTLKLLYPHKADRYWLLRLIMKSELKRASMKEEALATRINKSQPTISALVHLGKGQYKAARDTVLQTFAIGFEKDPSHVDALLWLFDGEPMTNEEAQRVYGKGGNARDYKDEKVLRSTMLSLLRGLLHEQSDIFKAQVQMRFNTDEAARLAEARELLRLEGQPGQRISVTRYPPTLVCPTHAFQAPNLLHDTIQSTSAKQEFMDIQRQRQNHFQQSLALYGVRGIHSKQGLREYLRGNIHHRVRDIDIRREQWVRWIQLLKKYDNYEIALVDVTPEFEIGIKNGHAVVLRSAPSVNPSNSHGTNTHWGLSHIFWRDDLSILFFLIDFERQWDAVASVDRDKKSVISWMETELQTAKLAKRAMTSSK